MITTPTLALMYYGALHHVFINFNNKGAEHRDINIITINVTTWSAQQKTHSKRNSDIIIKQEEL